MITRAPQATVHLLILSLIYYDYTNHRATKLDFMAIYVLRPILQYLAQGPGICKNYKKETIRTLPGRRVKGYYY